MEKLTYTPPEFAELFGKERTWAYRQLNAGKVQAVTELGRILIPKSEVDRLLSAAGRYLGTKAKVRKTEESSTEPREVEQKPANKWTEAVRRRMTLSRQRQQNGHFVNGRKSS